MIRGFAPGIFDEELYMRNTSNTSVTTQRRKAQSLYLVSGFRIHQVRVRAVGCQGEFSTWLFTGLSLLRRSFSNAPIWCVRADYLDGTKCFPEYSDDVEETAPFRPGNDSTWYWEDTKSVAGYDSSITGKFGT